MRLFSLLLLLALTGGCASGHSDGKLYRDLGGSAGIDAIVNGLIKRIGEDERIYPYFADSKVSRFRTQLTAHIHHLTGGPIAYEGDNMVDVHTGMDINESDFNHLVDLLIDAMDEEGIPHRIQNRLLATMAPLRGEIIYR